MKAACPNCGSERFFTTDSRYSDEDNRVIRIRHCYDCRYRYKTVEQIRNGFRAPIPDWLEKKIEQGEYAG